MNKRQINYNNDKQITAQRLKEAMDDIGISASELAAKSKIKKASISQYYNAHQAPSNISATAIAKVLGVNPVWLMGFDVPKHEETADKDEKNEAELLGMYRQLPKSRKKDVMDFTRMIYTNEAKNGQSDSTA